MLYSSLKTQLLSSRHTLSKTLIIGWGNAVPEKLTSQKFKMAILYYYVVKDIVKPYNQQKNVDY